MKKLKKIAYYVVFALILAVALLLATSFFPITGVKILTVLSGSMEPTISAGSIVVVRRATNYEVGEIVTFGIDAKTQIPTTHRIAEVRVEDGQMVYKTKGDANNAEDIREISTKDIVGKMYFAVPYAGYLVDFVRKPVGLLLIIVLPAIFIIYDEIRKIVREVKRIKKPGISNNTEENV